ncbi:manganese efflux pump MntP family protein [Desulfovermiculus halophilus]|jgi:putative Mn2+ efflux pump MntP|uniref:manganese efflux pump MntP n=1 Tax=Desulfovermiculus halophilus TaxID=339722 RepID=UPI0004862C95|nr:manganese efflux pump MntP family protein [Desulfovermiculus halophilus]
MGTLEILTLALALAMDAFAVSLGVGAKAGNIGFRQGFRLAWHFGLFQAGMPVVGWMAGSTVREHISAFDHWIAFGLLVCIGLKMIKEAFEPEEPRSQKDPTKGLSLIALSVATSIDAMAAGFSFSVLGISIWLPIVIIGIVAAGMTFLGLYLGSKTLQIMRLEIFAELIGGVVLIIIGVNVLIVHGVFT